jgi:hypothetical protein
MIGVGIALPGADKEDPVSKEVLLETVLKAAMRYTKRTGNEATYVSIPRNTPVKSRMALRAMGYKISQHRQESNFFVIAGELVEQE